MMADENSEMDDGRATSSAGRCGRHSGALDSAFRILARRDHTCKELVLKLRGKGYGRAAIDQALTRCRELGYLDDAKTARIIARNLVARGYGPLRVRQTLLQKGLDEPIIQKTLACCGDTDSQVSSARRVLEKKAARLNREADAWKRRQVAFRLLAGRGFPSAVISAVVADV